MINIRENTDVYFTKTRNIVGLNHKVTYAYFMRRPVLFATQLAVDVIKNNSSSFTKIECLYDEGDWVGSGDPMMYVTGYFDELVELETLVLQKLGSCCVAAYNAYQMATMLPNVAFMAMDARHCTGPEMADMMAYAAKVGSDAAKKEISRSKGFIGTSTEASCWKYFNRRGLGTMPHALIGFAGSTLEAARLYDKTFPEEVMTVLVDYYAKEIDDSLEVCEYFHARNNPLRLRLDTHGGRFIQGLDTAESYAVLSRHRPDAVKKYRSESELKYLIGTGVSAAAIFYLREKLNEVGFNMVQIVASSGFNLEKCKVMADIECPIDMIGTGSHIPDKWSETYATADIIKYDDRISVKVGREFLLKGLK